MPSEIKVPRDKCDLVIEMSGVIAAKIIMGKRKMGELMQQSGMGKNARKNGSVRKDAMDHELRRA